MTEAILVEISAGELFDKISILEIKSERIFSSEKLINIRNELLILQSVAERLNPPSSILLDLRVANEELWEIEDKIRFCEANQDFGSEFVTLARSVYMVNDRRAALKRKISNAINSRLIEEKSYQ